MNSMAQLNATLAAISQRMQRGAVAESEEQLNGILKQHPDHPGAHFMMGMIQVGREAWSDAEQSFRHALIASPGQPAVCLNLGHVLRAQHRPTEALDYCLIAAQASPDDIDAWAELAKAQEESGQPILAENSYRHILVRGPNDWATANLAALMNRSGRAADAEVLLRDAMAARPREIASRAALELQLGIALRAQRRYAEALEPLLRSRAQDASRDAAIEHANVLQHLARFAEAARGYEELLARDPLDMEIHTALNELSHRRGSGGCAPLTSYDLAQRRRPQAAILPAAKGNMLLKLGRTEEAREAFDRARHVVSWKTASPCTRRMAMRWRASRLSCSGAAIPPAPNASPKKRIDCGQPVRAPWRSLGFAIAPRMMRGRTISTAMNASCRCSISIRPRVMRMRRASIAIWRLIWMGFIPAGANISPRRCAAAPS